MANLFEEFKGMLKGDVPDENLLVPILIWASGSEKNIQMCQNVNRKFFNGNRKIFIREVSLNNNIRHVIRYPKISKAEDKTEFFYNDLCKYFGWTKKELEKNLNVLDIENLKTMIASAFAYDNKQRKLLKLEGIKYGKKKS